MNQIEGACVVFTGVFPRVRREIERDARLAGVWVEGQVTRRTQYLVTGDNPGGTKLNKAKAYGVQIVDYQTFLLMVGLGPNGEVKSGAPGKVEISTEWLEPLARKGAAVRF